MRRLSQESKNGPTLQYLSLNFQRTPHRYLLILLVLSWLPHPWPSAQRADLVIQTPKRQSLRLPLQNIFPGVSITCRRYTSCCWRPLKQVTLPVLSFSMPRSRLISFPVYSSNPRISASSEAMYTSGDERHVSKGVMYGVISIRC